MWKSIWVWISDHLAALVALAAVISSWLNRKKIDKLAINVDGKMENLLLLKGAEQHAVGEEEGRKKMIEESHARKIEAERIEDRETEKKP